MGRAGREREERGIPDTGGTERVELVELFGGGIERGVRGGRESGGLELGMGGTIERGRRDGGAERGGVGVGPVVAVEPSGPVGRAGAGFGVGGFGGGSSEAKGGIGRVQDFAPSRNE